LELAKELLILLGRIITIFPLLLMVTLIMGKRSIAELPVFDFLIIISLGAVVGADIADPEISHLHTAVAVVAIGLLQIIMARWMITNRTFGRLVTFEPTLVIRNGTFLVKNIRRIRYSLDNILQMLRENAVFDVSDVDLALVEANGKLTVQKRTSKESVTLEDMGISKVAGGFSYPVLVEGKIYTDVLYKLNLNEDWLKQHLNKKGITDMQSVFYASVNDRHQLHVSLVEPLTPSTPPIHH
jgi:uncharacterized membrane protein YcaP (DUF421 family)